MYLKQADSIDAQEFLLVMRPALEGGNLENVITHVCKHWTVPQITALLSDRDADVRKVAALALGIAGDVQAIKPLAIALHDADSMVHQMAEHAMWLIWLRCGKTGSGSLLKGGSQAMRRGDYEVAIDRFSSALLADPDCAEAYNQRAIAYYLTERYAESIADCKAALEKMPQHFGAMAGMGHCHAHMGQWAQARHCYRLALAINPRLEGICGALRQIDARLAREN